MNENLHKELVRLALVGTRRSAMTEAMRDELGKYGISKELSQERALLSASAIFSGVSKAGKRPKELGISQMEECNDAEESACSPTSIKHLYMIVDGAFEPALPEFLHHLSLNKKGLPPEILPDLLEQSLTTPELWRSLKENIGKRGEWLIRLNPDWSRLLDEPEEENWEEVHHDLRLRIFRKINQENPEKALNMLKETWRTESMNRRLDFLKVLEKNVSPLSETFLEGLLDDRRKEIRRAAVRLLAKANDTALADRMFDRASNYVTLNRGKVSVNLPDRLEDDMIRDGIDPRVQWFKGGVKAGRLGQILALVHPQRWCKKFGMNAKEVLAVFTKSDWAELMAQAMIEATALHEDPEWTEALLSFRIQNTDERKWQGLNIGRLLEIVTDEAFNRVAVEGMKSTSGLLEENSPITTMLKTCVCHWSDELTVLVVQNLKDWLAGETSRYWNGWHYRTILKKAAYTCNPYLQERLSADWPRDSRIWSSWEREIEEFLSVLYFRRKMIDELRESKAS